MSKRDNREETAVGRTNRKRFASGLDVAYSITLPLGIHSEKIRKQCRSADTKTPTKGKIFGWDKCFHHMISRHNPWLEAEQ